MEEVTFSVEWDRGKITGFKSKRDAQRYIELICKKVAGNLEYSIYNYYRSPSKKTISHLWPQE